MLADLVDLGRYPIDRPDSRAYDQMVTDLRRELEEDGVRGVTGICP